MKRLGAFVVVVLLAVGCARQGGVVQPDAQSMLLLTGNIQGSVLVLDGNRVGQIDQIGEWFDYKDGKGVQFTVDPGTHQVEVRKDGRLLVNRKLYLNDQQTMEVVVP